MNNPPDLCKLCKNPEPCRHEPLRLDDAGKGKLYSVLDGWACFCFSTQKPTGDMCQNCGVYFT